MTVVLSLFAQLLHIGLILVAAPTVAGTLDSLDARLCGRSGPPILAPWRDLARLSRPWCRLSRWGWPLRLWPMCWSSSRF
jgi:formate hydrogenlyase subunit 4